MSEGGGLSAGELQRRAIRGATWSTISSTVALPLAILVSVVLARTLGPQEFARFAFLSFLVPFLFGATDLGFGQAMTRFASQSFAAGDLPGTRDLLGKALGWNLLRLPMVSAITVIVVGPDPVLALVLVGSLIASNAGSGLLFSIQAENRGAVNAKLAFLAAVTSGVSSMIAAVSGASGTTVFVVNLVAGVVVVPGWILVANPSLRRAAMTPRMPRALPDVFWRYAITVLVLSLLSTLVFSRSEVAILEFLGEHQALAVFALAFGLAQRLTTPVDTILGPLLPALSAIAGAHPERMRAGFDRALRISSAAVAFLAGAAVIGTMLIAPVMFGPEYAGTGTAFAALAAVSLLRAGGQPYLALAHAIGRPAILLRANIVALVVDVALAFALIPSLGLWGAVIANAVGGAIAIVMTARATAVASDLRHVDVPFVRLGVLALVSCAAAYGLGLAGGEIHAAVGAVAAFAGGTTCFVVLARLSGGLLPAADADVLFDLLPARLVRIARPVIVAPSQAA